jgi:hypothetical protein
MAIALTLSVLAIVLWLNTKATLAVGRDAYSMRRQKSFQLLLIWLVPIAGSLIVLAIHRPSMRDVARANSISIINLQSNQVSSTSSLTPNVRIKGRRQASHLNEWLGS